MEKKFSYFLRFLHFVSFFDFFVDFLLEFFMFLDFIFFAKKLLFSRVIRCIFCFLALRRHFFLFYKFF